MFSWNVVPRHPFSMNVHVHSINWSIECSDPKLLWPNKMSTFQLRSDDTCHMDDLNLLIICSSSLPHPTLSSCHGDRTHPSWDNATLSVSISLLNTNTLSANRQLAKYTVSYSNFIGMSLLSVP